MPMPSPHMCGIFLTPGSHLTVEKEFFTIVIPRCGVWKLVMVITKLVLNSYTS